MLASLEFFTHISYDLSGNFIQIVCMSGRVCTLLLLLFVDSRCMFYYWCEKMVAFSCVGKQGKKLCAPVCNSAHHWLKFAVGMVLHKILQADVLGCS